MTIVEPSVEIINPQPYQTVLETVEKAIRNCYKSEDKITEGSAENIIRGCLARGHESPIEFADITVKITTDRSTSHQLVRHRLCSLAQCSQRYVNYSKDKFGQEIKVVVPQGLTNEAYEIWRAAMLTSESAYMVLTKDKNIPAEVARSVLPNSTATTIFMKANIREWRHIFELRCDHHSQKDIRLLMTDLLKQVYTMYPVFFEDLYKKFCEE